MEKPYDKMDDLGEFSHYFWKHPFVIRNSGFYTSSARSWYKMSEAVLGFFLDAENFSRIHYIPGKKHRNEFLFFWGGNWIVGLSGFKLMELNIMQFVFQVQWNISIHAQQN